MTQTYLPSITVTHSAKQAGLLRPCMAMRCVFCKEASIVGPVAGAEDAAAGLNLNTAWQGDEGSQIKERNRWTLNNVASFFASTCIL